MSKFGVSIKLFSYMDVSNHLLLVSATLVSTVAAGLILPISTILTGRVFDLLAQADQYEDKQELYRQLVLRSMSIMALGGASLPITWSSISTWMTIGEIQGFEVRERILSSYMARSQQWLDMNGDISGKFTQLNRCVEELRSGCAETSALTSRGIVTMLALIGTSFYYSWSLTLVTMCSAPIIVIVGIGFSRLIERNVVLENEQTSQASRSMTWCMNAIKLVKLSCTQLKEISKFREHTKESRNNFLYICTYTAANTAILRFLALTMFVQSFWFGSTMVRNGKLSVGDVITCFQSCILLGATINGFLHQILIIQKGNVAVKHINLFLEYPDKKTTESYQNHSAADFAHGNIIFDRISFAYPNRPADLVLKDVSLLFPGGRTTFIVGKSGSGKSTLSNLMLRFYEDYAGSITIGGQNIKTLQQDSLIKNISLVEQKCNIFNETLKNNILFASGNTSENEEKENLKTACRLSLLEKVILDLPEGLETLVGSGGVALSGGQQQRLAIARAFMRDTPVLILDEAVSALDGMLRNLLVKAIKQWRKGKTTIVLTHDLNQIDAGDFLYLFEDGECTEKGYQQILSLDINSKFYQWKQLGCFKDNSDNISQLTTVEEDDCEEAFLESYIDMDVETPKQEHDQEFFPKIDDFVSTTPRRVGNTRMKVQRMTTDEIIVKNSMKKTQEHEIEGKLMSIQSIIKRMWKASRTKALLCIGILFSLIAGAANPVFSYTFSFLLNGIVPVSSGVGSKSYLLRWSFIVIGVAATDALFGFFKDFILGYCSENWIMNLRNEAMTKVMFKELDWFLQAGNKESEISALVLNDLRDLRSLVTEFLGAISTFIMISALGLTWALISGWKLSLVCISMFPLIILFSAVYGILLQKSETQYKTSVAELENLLYEISMGVKTIRCLQIENKFRKKYKILEDNMRKVARSRAVATGFGVATTEALTTCIQAILFYYALKLVISGEYTSQHMFETVTLLLFTIMSCSNLVNQIPDISRGQRASTWLYRILDHEDNDGAFNRMCHRQTEIIQEKTSHPLVCIKDLTFSYPSAQGVNIFRHLNLKLFTNHTIAVAGESGSGKSTLVYLLTHLHRPPANTVFIDGTDINDWGINDLRNQIAVVDQKPTLFHGSIRENLTYGVVRDVLEIEIYDMLKYVGIFNFVKDLSDELETVITSDLLSGGQAQRLCIARALLKKPKILILDECTSALDPASSHIINELVRSGPPAMLTISITHSEVMMRSCDEIVLLKNGRVIERGHFEELFKERGELFKLIANTNENLNC